MNRIFVILVILITLLSLTSCDNAATQSVNDMPDMDIKAENWNTSIRLVDDPVLSNSYKNGKDLTLRVENLSDSTIVFSDDFGIKIITWGGQDWTSLSNNFYYTFPKTLPTKKAYPLGLLVSSLPYVSDLSSSIKIRIVVIGHPEDSEKVSLGAYIDVMLNP